MSIERKHRAPGAASGLLAALATIAGTATSALAHHPTGGRTPATLVDGFLSGIGHPIIGPDHLAFIVAIGIATALIGGGPALIASFVAASAIGVLVHAAAFDLPLAEQVVALSVVAAGAFVALKGVNRLSYWLPLAAIAGIFHGFAFGETTVGAEAGVIAAYIVGIAIVTSAITLAVVKATDRMSARTADLTTHARAAGILLGCIGVVMLAGSLSVA